MRSARWLRRTLRLNPLRTLRTCEEQICPQQTWSCQRRGLHTSAASSNLVSSAGVWLERGWAGLHQRHLASSLNRSPARPPLFVDNDPDAKAAEALLDSLHDVENSSQESKSSAPSQDDILREALALAEAASTRGSPRAKALLGYLYRDGLGVSPDAGKARALLLDSAQAGDPYAQLGLGTMMLESLATHPAHPEEEPPSSLDVEPEIVVRMDESGAPKARYSSHEKEQSTHRETPAELVRKVRRARRKAGFADHEGREFAEHEAEISQSEYNAEREGGLHWLRTASDQGCGEAAVALANATIHENADEALQLYERAASTSRVPSAHFNLGQLYRDGFGDLEKDEKKSLKHFSMAAYLGDADAQFYVGHLYSVGEMGIEVDLASCRQYIQLAADQGHAAALYYLALLHRNGEGGLEISRGNFRRHLESAVECGNSDALACMAEMYYKGTDGVQIDKKRALDLYERAGRAGSNEALCSAAAMYFHGYGSDNADKHRAFLLYQEAAIRGSIAALRNIASMYYHGDGVPKSTQVAELFLKEAENQERADLSEQAEQIRHIGVQTVPAPHRGMPHTAAESNKPLVGLAGKNKAKVPETFMEP